MTLAALADFGSTYTKVTLVEVESGLLVGNAQAPTSLNTDIMDGYRAALGEVLEAESVCEPDYELAASSAAGGLRVAAAGLVPDLTAAAAKQAALNAGAKVELLLDSGAGEGELGSLEDLRPEILLFAGGTDGGQRDLVLKHARTVAARTTSAHVIVACNREVGSEVASIFAARGLSVDVVANVMPTISELQIEPAREAILRAFLEHVIHAKALSSDQRFERMVTMATPDAVLRATALFAGGTPSQHGTGEVVVVDVGGATTDVHSATERSLLSPGVSGPLLPVAPVHRTVEGDLGLRSNAPTVVQLDGSWIRQRVEGSAQALDDAIELRRSAPSFLPSDGWEAQFDRELAGSCIFLALRRHCGTMSVKVSPGSPPKFVLDGPDLLDAQCLVGTGGVLVHGASASGAVASALDRREAQMRIPDDPMILIDANYVLAAAGILSTVDADSAMKLLKSELLPIGEQRR